MSDLAPEEVQELRRLLSVAQRKESLGDMASDDFFESWWERPHMIAALVTLVPKQGESWTEERLMLWLEVVEKTARLVYGLSSEWSEILGVESPPQKAKADVASDEVEKDPEPAREEAERLADPPESTEPLRERIPAALADGPLSKDELYLALDQSRGVGAALAWLIKDDTVWEQDGRYGLPHHEQPVAGALQSQILELLERKGIALRKKEITGAFPDLIPGEVWDALDALVAAKKIEKCGVTSAMSYRTVVRAPQPIKDNFAKTPAAQASAAKLDQRVAEVAERARQEGRARPASPVIVRRVDPETLA